MVLLRCLVQEDNTPAPAAEQPPSWARPAQVKRPDRPMVSEDQVITVQRAGMTKHLQPPGVPYAMEVRWAPLVVMLPAPHATTLTHVLVYVPVMDWSVIQAVQTAIV